LQVALVTLLRQARPRRAGGTEPPRLAIAPLVAALLVALLRDKFHHENLPDLH